MTVCEQKAFTHTTVFSAGPSLEKNTFAFLLLNCRKKNKLIGLTDCFRLAWPWKCVSWLVRSRCDSPGAPKPMDVIRCPLTSMWCNSGDFTTHTPKHVLTWWKRNWGLSAAEVHKQTVFRLGFFFLSNLAVSAMCCLVVESHLLHY